MDSADFERLPEADFRRVAFFACNRLSTQKLTSWPSPGCELTDYEFRVTMARYWGLPCPGLAPYVGRRVVSGVNRGQPCDPLGRALLGQEVKGGYWNGPHDALAKQLHDEAMAAGLCPRYEHRDLFTPFLGAGGLEARHDSDARRQGYRPDLYYDPAVATARARLYPRRTILEVKTTMYSGRYHNHPRAHSQSHGHTVTSRAASVPADVRRKLRQADMRYNGTAAVGPPGPAETHLASFHLVPIVGGHFGEGNAELMDLIKRIARVLSASKWRQLGFKGPKGGVVPAEAGITRRVGLALDRANAQRVARCVSHGGGRGSGALRRCRPDRAAGP